MSTSSTISTTASRFSREALHDYQERSVDFIKSTPNCALWVDMGLGKTVATLTAIADLYRDFEISRVLVVAPLRVALTTWPEEVARWDHTRHLGVEILTGLPSAAHRERATRSAKPIHVINRELVPWLVDHLGGDWPYDMVVIDEASSFKSSKAKRFKALRKVLPAIERLIELTGTPAPNGLLDVWAPVFLLDRGERLGRTFTSYRHRYFESDYMGFNWSPRLGADERIHARLTDVVLRLSVEDYLQLPARIDNHITVQMPASARAFYNDLEQHFLAEFDGDDVEVLSAAALSNKLLQCANGAVYIDGGEWVELHDAKLDALAEVVEAAAGRPLLVAYNYRADLHRIQERFPNAVTLDKDPQTIARWNRGEIDMLLAHPASAGHGLNLQSGGETIVWFGLNWSLELYQQFNARLHRQGQERPVVVHHIVTEDTVDETVLAALDEKNTTQRALLNALRREAEGRTK